MKILKLINANLKTYLLISMLLCFLFCIGFIFTKQNIHEYIGLTFFIVVSFHIWRNRWWFKSLTKMRASFVWYLNTVITIFLLITAFILFICGLINSNYVFPFFNELSGSTARDIHSTAAYWILIFIGLHIGMHWDLLKKYPILINISSIKYKNKRFLFCLIELLIFSSGVWAFYDREILGKLFNMVGFEFWDRNRPQVLFYVLLISLIISIALCLKTIKKINMSSLKKNGGNK